MVKFSKHSKNANIIRVRDEEGRYFAIIGSVEELLSCNILTVTEGEAEMGKYGFVSVNEQVYIFDSLDEAKNFARSFYKKWEVK